MTTQLAKGSKSPDFFERTINGQSLAVPDSGIPYTHIQFRRFAGCPICNLHLKTFVARHQEIKSAGIREIVIFHSSVAALAPFQGNFPFLVIGDPAKRLYQKYGVGTSIFSILHPGALPGIFKGNIAKDKPATDLRPTGGMLGLPADFLISGDGTIKAVHYGKHAYDQWSVDELLSLVV